MVPTSLIRVGTGPFQQSVDSGHKNGGRKFEVPYTPLSLIAGGPVNRATCCAVVKVIRSHPLGLFFRNLFLARNKESKGKHIISYHPNGCFGKISRTISRTFHRGLARRYLFFFSCPLPRKSAQGAHWPEGRGVLSIHTCVTR